MDRNPTSHKGENGKVAIIGGSRLMHGAPLLSGLAAEASGVDLLYPCVPACHEDVAKSTALNFQVHPFTSDALSSADTEPILELLATMDSCVLGPGIARTKESIDSLLAIAEGATCSLVLDAAALQPQTLELVKGKRAVLTPHLGELERMEIKAEEIGTTAKNAGVTILLKGPVDQIASSDGTVQEVEGGNAGLTVGGTGDALAGLIAGLMVQGMDPSEACVTATTLIKRAGTMLFHEKGYGYTAEEVVREVPHLLHTHE